jgi:hypothetical protein
MGLPRQLGPSDPGSGHGPFGQTAFRCALLGCVALIAIGLLMVLLGGDAPKAAGASLLALGGLGLLTSGVGLLLERVLGRHPPPPAKVRRGNGRGRHSPGRASIERSDENHP